MSEDERAALPIKAQTVNPFADPRFVHLAGFNVVGMYGKLVSIVDAMVRSGDKSVIGHRTDKYNDQSDESETIRFASPNYGAILLGSIETVISYGLLHSADEFRPNLPEVERLVTVLERIMESFNTSYLGDGEISEHEAAEYGLSPQRRRNWCLFCSVDPSPPQPSVPHTLSTP